MLGSLPLKPESASTLLWIAPYLSWYWAESVSWYVFSVWCAVISFQLSNPSVHVYVMKRWARWELSHPLRSFNFVPLHSARSHLKAFKLIEPSVCKVSPGSSFVLICRESGQISWGQIWLKFVSYSLLTSCLLNLDQFFDCIQYKFIDY